MNRIKFDEKNKIWSTSHIRSVYNSNISIGHLLLRSMELNGPKIAQVRIFASFIYKKKFENKFNALNDVFCKIKTNFKSEISDQ